MDKFRRKIIYPLLIASLILTGAMGWLFFAAYNAMHLNAVQDRLDSLRFLIIKFENTLVEAETGQRGYLLTNNVTFLDSSAHARIKANQILNRIYERYAEFPEIEPMFNRIGPLVNAKFQTIDASIQVQLHAGSYASHLSVAKDKGKQLMESMKSELERADDSLVDHRHRIEQQIKRSLKEIIFGSFTLVLVILSVLIFSYRRTVALFELMVDNQVKAEQMSFEAMHDPLTMLSNRRDFDQYLKKIHIVSKRKHDQYAVLYLDLDGFKAINDHYGHDAGDVVLVNVAERFSKLLRQSDFLARLGGDEFALIVQRYKELAELELLSKRLIQSLKEPFVFGSEQAYVGVSIGIACYPTHGGNIDGILSAADAAMYHSKQNGKNTYSFAT